MDRCASSKDYSVAPTNRSDCRPQTTRQCSGFQIPGTRCRSSQASKTVKQHGKRIACGFCPKTRHNCRCPGATLAIASAITGITTIGEVLRGALRTVRHRINFGEVKSGAVPQNVAPRMSPDAPHNSSRGTNRRNCVRRLQSVYSACSRCPPPDRGHRQMYRRRHRAA